MQHLPSSHASSPHDSTRAPLRLYRSTIAHRSDCTARQSRTAPTVLLRLYRSTVAVPVDSRASSVALRGRRQPRASDRPDCASGDVLL
eukprot:357003-Chlamydomonas_euryale.AAC.6